MKLSRIRFTIGRMMLVVAMAAFAVGGYVAFVSLIPADGHLVGAYVEVNGFKFYHTSSFFWIILGFAFVAIVAIFAFVNWLIIRAIRHRNFR